MTDPFDLDLAAIAAGIAAGEITARQVADRAIANYDATAQACGAYLAWQPERIVAAADSADGILRDAAPLGPLHGIPVSVKDIYGVGGYPTFAGTAEELPPDWRREGPLVRKLRQQMGVITGKTHSVEFAFGGVGTNPHWDTPRNPWDADVHRVPGGSSSGAGVSLVTGTALAALGTDTAGSVRIPASVTGTVGVKTTYGRWPLDGIVPLSPSLDTAGILARSVADAAFAFFALDPLGAAVKSVWSTLPRSEIDGLRIGVPDAFFWEDCSPGVAEGVKGALDELAASGARIVPLDLPEAETVTPIFRKGGLAAAELFCFLTLELPDWLEKIDPIVRQRMAEAESLPAHEYLARVRVLNEAAASASKRLSSVDVLACPAVPITPPTLADVAAVDDYRATNLLMLRNTAIVNYLGLCALSLPVALDQANMPVGLQLIAPAGADERLLSAGLACEAVLGTGRQRLGKAPLAY